MLTVLRPLPYVFGAVTVLVNALTLSLVIEPFALIHVAIKVDESALAVGLVVVPVTYVLAPIFPDLSSFPFSEAVFGPRTMIDGAVIKLERASLNGVYLINLTIQIKIELPVSQFYSFCDIIKLAWHLFKFLCEISHFTFLLKFADFDLSPLP